MFGYQNFRLKIICSATKNLLIIENMAPEVVNEYVSATKSLVSKTHFRNHLVAEYMTPEQIDFAPRPFAIKLFLAARK